MSRFPARLADGLGLLKHGFGLYPGGSLGCQGGHTFPKSPVTGADRAPHRGQLLLMTPECGVQRFERFRIALERLDGFVSRKLDMSLLRLKIADGIQGILERTFDPLALQTFRIKCCLCNSNPIGHRFIRTRSMRPSSSDDSYGDLTILHESARGSPPRWIVRRMRAQGKSPRWSGRCLVANRLPVFQAESLAHFHFRAVRLSFGCR